MAKRLNSGAKDFDNLVSTIFNQIGSTMERKSFYTDVVIVVLFMVFSTISFAGQGVNPPGDEEYLAAADVMPAPVGGLGAIMNSISYPTVAKQTGIEGKVYVLAYVNEKGGVDDVKVLKGIGGGCDEAASNAVKKAKFTPGQHAGKPVKVKLSLAIAFKLK